MYTHYSEAKIGEWYKDKGPKSWDKESGQAKVVERYGFGFDAKTPHGSPSLAFVTYRIDLDTATLHVDATTGSDEFKKKAGFSVKCGDVAEAIDYSTRLDAALGPIVGDRAPQSYIRDGLDVPRWVLDPKHKGKDLSGLRNSDAIAEVMALADKAVKRSYGSPDHDVSSKVTVEAGLTPLDYRTKGGAEGLWFRGGHDGLFIDIAPGRNDVCYSEKHNGDFPTIAKGSTISSAIAAAARAKPHMFEGLVQVGMERQFQDFVTIQTGADAARARVEADKGHRPYEQAKIVLGLRPAGQRLMQKMLGERLTDDSRVGGATAPAPAVASAAAPRVRVGLFN
jgi:hypothetical protein